MKPIQTTIEPNISVVEATLKRAGFRKRKIYTEAPDRSRPGKVQLEAWIHDDQPHLALYPLQTAARVMDLWMNVVVTNVAVGLVFLPVNEWFHSYPSPEAALYAWGLLRTKDWCHAPRDPQLLADFVVSDLRSAWRYYYALHTQAPVEA